MRRISDGRKKEEKEEREEGRNTNEFNQGGLQKQIMPEWNCACSS